MFSPHERMMAALANRQTEPENPLLAAIRSGATVPNVAGGGGFPGSALGSVRDVSPQMQQWQNAVTGAASASTPSTSTPTTGGSSTTPPPPTTDLQRYFEGTGLTGYKMGPFFWSFADPLHIQNW